jgi:hypothetical protein
MAFNTKFTSISGSSKINGYLYTDFLANGKITDLFLVAITGIGYFLNDRVTAAGSLSFPSKGKWFDCNGDINSYSLVSFVSTDIIMTNGIYKPIIVYTILYLRNIRFSEVTFAIVY